MRKQLSALALLCLTLVLATASQAAVGPDISASLLYYEPVPATPGSLIDVYIQIANTGTQADQITVTFVDNGPFSVDNEADRVKTTPSIPSQGNFLLKYKVRVSPDAITGPNNIKIEYRTGTSPNVRSLLLPLSVSSTTVSVSVKSVTVEPAVLIPGNDGTVTLVISNDADQRITSGTAKLDLSGVDLIPIQGTNQQRFSDLPAQGERSLVFRLAPSPTMQPGVYKTPVNISFIDQQGNTHSMSEVIGIRVGAEPEVSITLDDAKVNSKQSIGDVFIKVTNRGIGEIKFVNIVLGESETYDIVAGGDERYVGNIDSDDYKTAKVTIEAKDTDVTIPVTVTFLDALNTKHTQEAQLSLKVRAAESGGNGLIITVIVVLALLVGGYFLMRKRK
jgi:hypothetical protein